MEKVTTRKCPVCLRNFSVGKGARRKVGIIRRSKRNFTCSMECSKIYNRCVRVYRFRRAQKKEKKK